MTGIRRAAVLAAALIALAACDSGASAPRATPPATAGGQGSTPAPAQGSATGVAPAGLRTDWPMYHGDPAHSGYAPDLPAASGAPRLAASIKLDGQVLASPIVEHGVTFVATENGSVYALDSRYRQLWRTHLGSPSPAQQRRCGDIDPLGITGTPIFDPSSGNILVVAELGGNVRHQLVALSSSTGTVRWSRSVDLPGVSAKDMQQRGALAITHGRVWVSFGAQAGDCGRYKGRVVGVRLDGHGAPVAYTAPTERGGGIWNPAGPTVGPDGDLLVVSANGAAFPGDRYDHTNSVLRLDGDARLVDSFAPSDWAVNNRDDVGLGSQGVALVGSRWAVLGGKSGPVYVLRRDRLGGIGGQVSTKRVCLSFGGAAVQGSTVYLPCLDGVRAVRITSAGGIDVRWRAASSVTGSPIVGGGRVWALDSDTGVLHALDPATGRDRGSVAVGAVNRFATPAVNGRDLLVPTLNGLAVVRTS